MSDLGMQFVRHARRVNHDITDHTPRITYLGQPTFVKWCEECHANYPHLRHADCTECAVCGTKTHAVKPAADQ